MKKLLLFFALLCATSTLFSQSYSFSISGKITDKNTQKAVEAATIHIENVKDSTVISYTISDEKGDFSLKGKSFYKDVKLYVSYIGLSDYAKTYDLSKKNTFKLGTISLTEESNVLDEVVVKSRAPITVKKDTLEFNVKSFKTKKDANVEDLLKKLPGVEVDAEGKITVNGKPVNKILVNGKPFFGSDPSITTKNLTKEIIEKVQITDTKTKSEAFSGEKGDANNKTINLTIKKENNKGWFGRVSASTGTDERYEGATMINRFNNDTRISILASTNNINSPGFSFGEIQKMFGGGNNWVSGNGSFSINGRRFGGGQGIVKSTMAGATYADTYGKNVDVNANYIFAGSSSNNLSRNNREYIIPDNKYFTNSETTSEDDNDNHNFDFELDMKIDSTLLINIRPNFTFNKRSGYYARNEETLNEDREKRNSFVSNTVSSAEAKNFGNEIAITKRLGSKGSFIKASIQNRIEQSNSEDLFRSTQEILGDAPETNIRNQNSTIDNDFNGLQSRIAYRYPIIGKKFFVDAQYRYNRDKRENKRDTYDFNSISNDFTDFNTELSSDFTYEDITKTPSLELTYRTKKLRLNFEVGHVNRTLENKDALRPELSLKREFSNLKLDFAGRYRFDNKASFYFNYDIDNRPPSLNQLQPFENVSNPTNIVKGNPDLKPSQRHRGYFSFNKYNWQAGTGMYIYASGSYNKNQVVSDITIDPITYNRTTTYSNVDGGYDFWVGSSYSKKIKLDTISSLKFSLRNSFNGFKNFSILNGNINEVKTFSIRPELGLTYEWNKKISIEPRYQINFSETDGADGFNQRFTRHRFRLRTRTNIPKKLEWQNDIVYTYNPDVTDFNRSAWFWNSTLSYSIFKDKAAITLKAYDLLNQNTNARRSATSNYIEDSESSVLQQYFMLGFSWKFNTLGSKGKVKEYNFYH